MTKKLDALSVLAILARLHGTTIEEEIEKHNADIARRIVRGDIHPAVSKEERLAREKAVKQRASDKVKAARAARRASKPVPSAEEIAAKAVAKAERKKAARRRHCVKLRDALRAVRAKSGGRLHGGGPQKGVPVAERSVLTPSEKRARKTAADRQYRLAMQDALRASGQT